MEARLLLLLACVCGAAVAYDISLPELLRSRYSRLLAHKRQDVTSRSDGNPCPTPEKPFPCKSSSVCIPMGYVCDDNWDCEDGYDENSEVCTAAHRPPVEDIMHFLDNESGWLKPLLGGKSNSKMAHGLAVSPTVDEFQRRMGMDPTADRKLRQLLKAVKSGDEETVMNVGMPVKAWDDVQYFFGKLIKSGFYA